MSSNLPRQSKWIEKLSRLPAWAWMLTLVLVFGLAILAAGMDAQPQETAIPGGQTTSPVGLGVDIFVKLVFILVLIYASMFALRKFQTGSSAGGVKKLRVLETTHLSPRQKIHLVQVGRQVVLIGATDQNLSFLMDVDVQAQDAEQPELEAGASGPVGQDSQPGFAHLFSNVFTRRS